MNSLAQHARSRRIALFEAIVFAWLSCGAWALAASPRTEKLNDKVLHQIESKLQLLFVDRNGPVGFREDFAKARRELLEEKDECAFYRRLSELVDASGISHFRVSPPFRPARRKWSALFRAMRLERIEGREYLGRAVMGTPVGSELLEVNEKGFPPDGRLAFCGFPFESFTIRDPEGIRRKIDLAGFKAPEREPNVSVKELQGGWGYFRIASFERYSKRAVAKAFKRIRSAPGIVLDLRGNPGGGSDNLLHLLALFMQHDVSVGRFVNPRRYSKAMARFLSQQQRASHRGSSLPGLRSVYVEVNHRRGAYAGPLRVLIDRHCASATEIAAFVFQQTHRAVLVGRRTSGSVLGSLQVALADGGNLQLPALLFVGPHGEQLEGVGVKPDLEVAVTAKELAAGRDPTLDRAVDSLRQEAASAKNR